MKLTCKEAAHLVSEGLDRDLGMMERVRLRLHLLICDGCTNFSRQLAFIRKALRKLSNG
jgi:hypothetical protein